MRGMFSELLGVAPILTANKLVWKYSNIQTTGNILTNLTHHLLFVMPDIFILRTLHQLMAQLQKLLVKSF